MTFKVGDVVAIVYPYSPPHKTRISRVKKRFVEVEGGSKFTPTGYQYPELKGYMRLRIEHWDESHTEQARRCSLKLALSRVVVQDLQYRDVCAFLEFLDCIKRKSV